MNVWRGLPRAIGCGERPVGSKRRVIRTPSVQAFVRADVAATHERVMQAVSLLRRGVESPVIATNPVEEQ